MKNQPDNEEYWTPGDDVEYWTPGDEEYVDVPFWQFLVYTTVIFLIGAAAAVLAFSYLNN